jgi:hypothetical protein
MTRRKAVQASPDDVGSDGLRGGGVNNTTVLNKSIQKSFLYEKKPKHYHSG